MKYCIKCNKTLKHNNKYGYCIAHRSLRDRQYYINNKDKCYARIRKWIKNNPEKYKKMKRENNKKTLALRTKLNKLYRKQNPEKYRLLSKKHYYKHHEKHKTYARNKSWEYRYFNNKNLIKLAKTVHNLKKEINNGKRP